MPVLKSESSSKVKNYYKPISILSHISKFFEKLVLKKMNPSVNQILIDEQHVFRILRVMLYLAIIYTMYLKLIHR